MRPVGAVLGEFEIPDSDYYPRVGEGPYSSAAFLAQADDLPLTVVGLDGSRGLWNLDAELHVPSMTVPRWPANAMPASGSDGHIDIVDPATGIIHSFFKMRRNGQGNWSAAMYAWTSLHGRGWGDPAHYYQGARATAVPPIAGLIRKHEVGDGSPHYHHALAVSLTYNALSGRQRYVFPATSADGDWRKNYGGIPEGALLLLPPTFDTSQIANADLRKVAETLKIYGAYVVDRNIGTPFYIYVENGSNFNLHSPRWNSAIGNELKRIQKSLRQVVALSGWIDSHGKPQRPVEHLNVLSMRGPWLCTEGQGMASFDTHAQAVQVLAGTAGAVFEHRGNRSFNSVDWAPMQAGSRHALTCSTGGDALFQLQLINPRNQRVVIESKWMTHGDHDELIWPHQAVKAVLHVKATRAQSADDAHRPAWVQARLTPLEGGFQSPFLSNS